MFYDPRLRWRIGEQNARYCKPAALYAGKRVGAFDSQRYRALSQLHRILASVRRRCPRFRRLAQYQSAQFRSSSLLPALWPVPQGGTSTASHYPADDAGNDLRQNCEIYPEQLRATLRHTQGIEIVAYLY